MAQSNISGVDVITRSAVDPWLESRIMATFSPRLRNWLMYDAPWDHDVVGIYKLIRDKGVTEERILYELRKGQRVECRQMYGPGHPQASLH